MSYFDNANNRVTRKSFGSKVDKEFKREGVIPVRDRSKKDTLAESAAKYQELNKKVNERRMNELKEQKEFEAKIQEGYKNLKDELMKDFISEICVESLLVDEEVVNENLKNIIEMVERQVDDIGGFEGVKRIAETTNNPILLNMVNVCEATAKKVGERNVKEGKANKDKVNFGLQKIDLEEFDYRKKEIGAETIVNNIKDKVFQVVQDEQKLSADKQMVMDDIQNKVSELQAPVEEAMKFIFDRPSIEEDTLFNSMMRSHYKQIMESNSSAIFESFDYKDEKDPLFEDCDFDMKDIELMDEEIENEEIVDMFINEAKNLPQENLEEELEGLFKKVQEGSEFIQSKSQATHFKGIVRKVQDVLENMEIKIEDYELPEEDDEPVQESTVSQVEAVRKKLLETEDPSGDSKTLEKEMKEFDKANKANKKEVTEEVILCPKCGKEECTCKVAKESIGEVEEIEEGVKAFAINQMADLSNSMLHKRIAKRDFENVRGNLAARIKGIKTSEELDLLAADFKLGVKQLEETKRRHPDQKEKLDKHIRWLKTDGKKMLEDQRKYIEKQKLNEACILKLEDVCEAMNTVIEAHENARTNVIESLTKEINGEYIIVPYLQTKDVNLNNLEFTYKTKMVCESLKNELKHVECIEEALVLNKAIELNIKSIEETLEVIKENSDMEYKTNVLRKGKGYLEKVNDVLTNRKYESNAQLLEHRNNFKSPEDVEKIFEQVREYYVIESTDNDLMELVMAEAIVDYTILETFNTLNLVKYTKDSIRQMCRKNISK